MTARPALLVILSAPVEIARRELAAIRTAYPEHRTTVYLRLADRPELADVLTGCDVHSDKPAGGKRRFLAELRMPLYETAIVLDYGHWSFHPARMLFFAARARNKLVHTERGAFRFTLKAPGRLFSHWIYRRKNRSGSVAGLPPGTPAPFALALYRKTLGLVVGLVWTVVEYGYRRVLR